MWEIYDRIKSGIPEGVIVEKLRRTSYRISLYYKKEFRCKYNIHDIPLRNKMHKVEKLRTV
jgi:hypothetical protein